MTKVHQLRPRNARSSGYNSGSDDGEPPMSNLEARVDRLEDQVSDVRVTLARIETKLDNCVTKAQLTTYALIALIGVLGGGWWVVQQYLAPLLQAAGS